MTAKVLVVGSGVIGLRTALELLRNNVSVVLKSAHHPLNRATCSMGAGGLWMPYKCDDKRIDKWSKETLDELLHIHTFEKDKSRERPLVEIVPTLYLTNKNNGPTVEDFKNFEAADYSEHGNKKSPLPEWTKDSRLAFQHLTLDMLAWQNQVLKLRIPSVDVMKEAGYTHGWLFRPPIVDPPRMLTHMLQEVMAHPLAADVNVEMKDGYQSMDEMVEDAHNHGCETLINCTGLGSAKLDKDEELVGGRGILLHYGRDCTRNIKDDDLVNDAAILTEDEPWGTSTDPVYIIPRGDVFVVGGSYHENNAETEISEKERKRLVVNAALLGIDTSTSSPVDEWTGFRPVRKNVRMEIDENISSASKVRVFHSYGHGGSGWTTYAGVAKDTVKILGYT